MSSDVRSVPDLKRQWRSQRGGGAQRGPGPSEIRLKFDP